VPFGVLEEAESAEVIFSEFSALLFFTIYTLITVKWFDIIISKYLILITLFFRAEIYQQLKSVSLSQRGSRKLRPLWAGLLGFFYVLFVLLLIIYFIIQEDVRNHLHHFFLLIRQ